MISAAQTYIEDVQSRVATAWNQFWFTPAAARPLARVRIAANAIAFVCVLSYISDLNRLFDVDGMLPVDFIRDLFPHQWSPLDQWPANLAYPFWAATLVALALAAAGIGGRASQAVAWFGTLGLFHRVSLTNGPVEAVLSLILAYLLVGRASDDFAPAFGPFRRSNPAGTKSAVALPVVSNRISLRLLQLHIAAIHVTMLIAQLTSEGDVWIAGEGLWIASQSPGATIHLTEWELSPKLVALWSHTITLYLACFPVFAWRPRALPLLAAWGAFAWLSLAAATGHWSFAAAMAAGSLAFFDQRVTGPSTCS